MHTHLIKSKIIINNNNHKMNVKSSLKNKVAVYKEMHATGDSCIKGVWPVSERQKSCVFFHL